MTIKDRLHQLVDELPEGEASNAAAEALEQLRLYWRDPLARKLLSAPIDDEPETEAERRATLEALEDVSAGRVLSTEELHRELRW